ncbi:4-hydroxyphenylacetate 3-hydroxylase N-terminal domain-containing protein [Moorella sulfitireducens]|uniref:4-hydroxyphenylacetate 3-hydroxylase N-terminal domain-containing protein n=1 Tax=Neomoorella sulfitireducens TaxID=2972948 RepID=UPI0021AD1B24|nr:4-hydroxyphenylacetate 3-hydroxylase N-terminal domain-containing protein [Moorella sulfitireducens]
MALITREAYLQLLKSMRPNIYKFGQRIDDVTTHPATRRTVESHARAFGAAYDPQYADIFTTVSSFTGEKIHRFNSLMQSLDDIIYNAKFKRMMYRLTGTCTGGVCVGWNAQNVMWNVTYEMDRDLNTNYRARLEKWIRNAQEKGLVVAGALTDAKGDRSLRPSQQPDPDSNVRIKEVRDDGIVISGAKVMICGVAAANEIFILPGSAYREEDQDYAVACVIPRDIEGLTIVETRRPSDERELEEGFDIPETGITQAYLIFEDVFVPNERVFMCKEFKYTGKIIQYFTANYRACIGACVAGQGDVMIGAAAIMARSNGLAASTFMNKLIDMAINNETTYGLGIGAMALGKKHEGGAWVSDPLIAHTNKVLVATLPYETKRICQDIGGGIVETGCFPSYKDFTSPEYGHLVQKYVKAAPNLSAETRARAARLVEWLTLGAGVPGCMHGGGSPDGARLVVRASTPIEEFVEYAKKIAGITEAVPEPAKKK